MRHPSNITINLPAIVANWQFLNDRVGEHCCCASVVKADAYGLGVKPVARALYVGGCRLFFVATVDEGIELRQCLAVDDCEIIIFGGLAYDSAHEACSSVWNDYRLIPVLLSVDHIARWERWNRNNESSLPCLVKLDTGMHRTGISPNELSELLRSGRFSALNIRYLMAHFACADEPKHPMNAHQLSVLEACLEDIRVFDSNCRVSLCNSPGIFLDEKPYYDLVRPGIALYGGHPVNLSEKKMQPVVTLQLAVMQIKTIRKGDSVGYGASFIASKAMRIAIVSGGYADGLLRSLSNLGKGYCNGKAVPIVGRVSMDTMVFDISEVDGACDSIEMLGDYQSIDDLAAAAGTIAYEILTGLSRRFHRQYIPFCSSSS